MPAMTQPEQKSVETDAVYLTVRHKKKTIMFFCKESDSIHRVKNTLAPLVKTRPENQKLYYGTTVLTDERALQDCGINSGNAKAQQPVELYLSLREDGGYFQDVDIMPYSTPPPLPDVMKEHQN